MEKLTTEELKLIAEKRGIKNYQNMSRKKVIRALDKSKRNFKDIALTKFHQLQKCKIFHGTILSKSQK